MNNEYIQKGQRKEKGGCGEQKDRTKGNKIVYNIKLEFQLSKRNNRFFFAC